jgi:hypothetical protein
VALERLPAREVKAAVEGRSHALLAVQTQILYDVAGMLEEVLETLRNALARPRGLIFPVKVLVDKLTVIDFVGGLPHTPLFSITVYNDGPDEVYVSVNEYQRVAPLKPGESLAIDCHAPSIERLYLDVDEGKKAAVRAFGLY